MTAAELREAIEQPAFLVGCEPEPGLTERLLADVEGQPGALPLLQFALTEVWKKRDVRRLTLRAYTELGKDDKGEQRGIEGVLDHRANEIYRNLTPVDQDLCRRLFLRLVQPGEGTEDTKRRVSYRELLPDDPARAEAVWKLVQTLASRDARLITTEGTDATEGAVEVAHEALIRGWTQLRQWVDAERTGLRIHRRLTEDAQEWADARPEAKEDFLYSGARLAVCREWVATHRDELNPIEGAFLAASEEAERQREQDALENERRLREAAEAARARSGSEPKTPRLRPSGRSNSATASSSPPSSQACSPSPPAGWRCGPTTPAMMRHRCREATKRRARQPRPEEGITRRARTKRQAWRRLRPGSLNLVGWRPCRMR